MELLSRDEERGRRAYKEFFREQHMVGNPCQQKEIRSHDLQHESSSESEDDFLETQVLSSRWTMNTTRREKLFSRSFPTERESMCSLHEVAGYQSAGSTGYVLSYKYPPAKHHILLHIFLKKRFFMIKPNKDTPVLIVSSWLVKVICLKGVFPINEIFSWLLPLREGGGGPAANSKSHEKIPFFLGIPP